MNKQFGVIRKGDEREYTPLLTSMESNMIKMSRLHNIKSGRSIVEAIHICLLAVEGYLKNIEYDFAPYEQEKSKNFVHALLMSFDPFTNAELRAIAEKEYDLNSADELEKYFKVPVMCLLRIKKSIELWTKDYGSDGYIYFLESQIGKIVKLDDKMDYTYMVRDKVEKIISGGAN